MEALFILITLILAIIALTRAGNAIAELTLLRRTLKDQGDALVNLSRRLANLEGPTQPSQVAIQEDLQLADEHAQPPHEEIAPISPVGPIHPQPVPPPLPPPLPVFETVAPTPPAPAKPAPAPVTTPKPAFNLEHFLGANLFAWAAGLAAFLGAILFVKYSFEHDLIPPALRVALGFIAGIALAATGLKLRSSPRFTIMSQVLAATGVLVLYGVTFAARNIYHFQAFNIGVTFLLMCLITVVAFLMAVRMNAAVVAVLGMLGGFLTPLLCSTGQDNALVLFMYIALLDLGILAVLRYKPWAYLAPLAAVCTILMEIGWAGKFFVYEGYAEGTKTWVVVAVFGLFPWVFAAGARWLYSKGVTHFQIMAGAVALSLAGFMQSLAFLGFDTVADRPLVLYALVLLVNGAALWIAWLDRRMSWSQPLFGVLTFGHLILWTSAHLTNELLITALAIYMLFGVIHTAFAALILRKHGSTLAAAWTPVVILLLMMVPLLKLAAVSFLLWPALLLANLFVIGLALLTRNVWPVAASLLLTLLASTLWLFKLPHEITSLLPFLAVLGLFAVLFVVASLFLGKRLPEMQSNRLNELLPTASAALPFALLIMATQVLPVANPAPIFGFAALLTLFLIVLGRITSQAALSCAAAVSVLMVEFVWHGTRYNPDEPMLALPWYLGFLALFIAHPIVFHPRWKENTVAWAGSCVSAIGTFVLVHWLVKTTWPNNMMGLIPALFVIPPAIGLLWVLKNHAADSKARIGQLALLGGTVLLFITLIFPIQFSKQWLTIAWAMEGAALCWLFLRVPHRGLLVTGTVLLTISFIRLGLNAEVLSYHQRSGAPILNWFLYTYGLAAAANFAAAYFVKKDGRLGEIPLRGLFCSYAGILLFLLMNIEIADAFTVPGEHFITFQFSGNLARDMTYTISWGLFALTLLVIGFKIRNSITRYVGIGLLGLALLKLFTHDLSDIDGIFRIGALLVVALIAFAASYLYQRFAETEKPKS